jgi:adenylylsulfate kinase-like enzyme
LRRSGFFARKNLSKCLCTPLELCIERDAKGLYARTLAGPTNSLKKPEQISSTKGGSPEALAERVIEFLGAVVSASPDSRA